VHGPLQAKKTDRAKYRGRYDAGWDEVRAARFERQKAVGLVPPGTYLSERDQAVPAWDDIPAEQRRLFARHIETYAAMLDCADLNIGRLVALLEDLGELANTIFVFSSDNGGTNSAGPAGTLHFNRRYAGLPALPVELDVEREAWAGTGRGSAVYPMGWAPGIQHAVSVLQDLHRRRGPPGQPCRLVARPAQRFRRAGAAQRAVLRMLGQPGLLSRRLGRGLVAEARRSHRLR
jgi:hypothetical protein